MYVHVCIHSKPTTILVYLLTAYRLIANIQYVGLFSFLPPLVSRPFFVTPTESNACHCLLLLLLNSTSSRLPWIHTHTYTHAHNKCMARSVTYTIAYTTKYDERRTLVPLSTRSTTTSLRSCYVVAFYVQFFVENSKSSTVLHNYNSTFAVRDVWVCVVCEC